MKMPELNETSAVLPKAAIKLLDDLPVNFFGRIVLIFESGKIQRMEMQQSFHLREASKQPGAK